VVDAKSLKKAPGKYNRGQVVDALDEMTKLIGLPSPAK
jgi:hypothetical protein